MLVYWVSLLFAVFFEWLAQRAKAKSLFSSRLLTAIAMLAPILTLGLRVGIGTDYYTYQDIFYWNAAGVRGSIEYGWYLYSKICHFIVPDYRFQLLLTAALFIGLSRSAMDKLSANPVLSVFLLYSGGFFFASMNMMKQMLAAAILLRSLVYARDSKAVRFFACVAVAALVHSSATVFAIVYFARRLSNKGLMWSAACFMVLAVTGVYGSLVELVASGSEKYSAYYGSAFDNGRVAYVAIIVDASIIALAFLLRSKLPSEFKEGADGLFRILLGMQVLSLYLALTTGIVPLGDRLRRYFSIGMVLFVPDLLSLVEDKRMRFLVSMLVIAAFCVYMQLTIAVMGHYGVYPYTGIFDNYGGYL